MSVFYHGAPALYDSLEPQYSALVDKKVLFVTPLHCVAAVFSLRWDDSQFSFSAPAHGDVGGTLELRELVVGEFDRVFAPRTESYIYACQRKSGAFLDDARLGLSGLEFITEHKPRVIFTERIVARDELLQCDRIAVLLHDGSVHPQSHSFPAGHRAVTLEPDVDGADCARQSAAVEFGESE